MRILLINRNHYVNGGADRVYLNTGNLLEINNFKIAYFSCKNDRNQDAEHSKYFIKYNDTRSLSALGKIISFKDYLYNNEASSNLGNIISNFKPDVAHIHLFYGSLTASILVTLKKYNIPIVITIHDYRLICPANAMLDRHGKICEKCKNQNYYNCIFNRCSGGNVFYSGIITAEAYMRKYIFDPVEYIDHFIFVSNFSMRKHIESDNRFSTKSTHLYNFANINSCNIKDKGGYYLYYGRLSKEKGIINLIYAAAKLNVNLIIAGNGPQEKEIIHCINGNNNIKYVGFKSGPELLSLITNASFVVVPSEWYENNPMTIVEAYSLGKPVIGSNIGGIPELVNMNTGILFEPGDNESLSNAIVQTERMNNEDYRNMSNNCWEFAKNHFSEDEHIRKLKDIYNNIHCR